MHEWVPDEPVDVVIANEVLYLLDEPERAVQHIVGKWMKPGGRFVAGLDCYKENKLSHTWAEDLDVPMHCLPENTWKQIFIDSGLCDIEIVRSHSPGPWAGSLIIKGSKPL